MILNSIVTSDKPEHTAAVVEAKAVPPLVELLKCTNETANLQVRHPLPQALRITHPSFAGRLIQTPCVSGGVGTEQYRVGVGGVPG